jgi:hypothetical protein
MDEIIFCDFGIEIIKRNSHFFVRYDSGTAVARICEDEITEVEAMKAQLSEQDAYEVLLRCEKRANQK